MQTQHFSNKMTFTRRKKEHSNYAELVDMDDCEELVTKVNKHELEKKINQQN